MVALNVLSWGLLIAVVAPASSGAEGLGLGLGVTAFLLGVRHAFDADHLASIDNTVRKLVGEGKPAETVGFWFALGHATVVFSLTALLAFGVDAVVDPALDEGSAMRGSLQLVGSLTAGSFLIVIGLMNLSALVGIVHLMRHARAGTFDEAALEHHLHQRGFLARIFNGATRRVSKPVHLYPVGLLMGLGFDTATQVALLVLSASTASTALPWYAALVLPLLFASGMLLFDTADGVVMTRAYAWAFVRPLRRVYYNLTVTVLSVLVAFVIGGVVLLGVLAERTGVEWLQWASGVDMQNTGFLMVAIFLLVWGVSTLVWKGSSLSRSEGR